MSPPPWNPSSTFSGITARGPKASGPATRNFFTKLSKQQSPGRYLWIGCSATAGSRRTRSSTYCPEQLFVHRNIANVVVHTDLNCLSVVQFAVDVLKVKHIIVCGHYVAAAAFMPHCAATGVGLADNWLRHVRDVSEKHAGCLGKAAGEEARTNLLCEFNVIEQVGNVCQTTIVQGLLWDRGQELTVHGWIYAIKDGIIHSLGLSAASVDQVESQYRSATAAVASR